MEPIFSSEKLIGLRKLKGYSQEKLSDEAGINIRTLQRIEKNEVSPQPHTMSCLANALNVAIEELCVLHSASDNSEALNKQLSFLHFSTMLGCALPFGNIIAPFILFFNRKEKNELWNTHFKAVINFQLSWLLYTCILLLLFFTVELFGFMIFLIPVIGFVSFVFFPILSGTKVLKGKSYYYPLTIKII